MILLFTWKYLVLKTIFYFLGPIPNILASCSNDGSDIYHIYWLWAFINFSVSYSHNLHSLWVSIHNWKLEWYDTVLTSIAKIYQLSVLLSLPYPVQPSSGATYIYVKLHDSFWFIHSIPSISLCILWRQGLCLSHLHSLRWFLVLSLQ